MAIKYEHKKEVNTNDNAQLISSNIQMLHSLVTTVQKKRPETFPSPCYECECSSMFQWLWRGRRSVSSFSCRRTERTDRADKLRGASKQKFRRVQLNFCRSSNFRFCAAILSLVFLATLTLCQQGGFVSRNTVLQMEEQGSRHSVSKQQFCFSVHEKYSRSTTATELGEQTKYFSIWLVMYNMIKARTGLYS